MPKRLNISTARKELPALFDRVATREGERVIIRRRDGGEEAALISLGYLERLELAHRQRAAAKPFKLIGSGTMVVSVEDVLGEIRAADEREIEKRQRDFASRAPARRKTRAR
jgi:hypothetical protein